MHGMYGGPGGMKTRKDGSKSTTHGPGPKTPAMPARGPGPGQTRKAGVAPGRHVENKKNK